MLGLFAKGPEIPLEIYGLSDRLREQVRSYKKRQVPQMCVARTIEAPYTHGPTQRSSSGSELARESVARFTHDGDRLAFQRVNE